MKTYQTVFQALVFAYVGLAAFPAQADRDYHGNKHENHGQERHEWRGNYDGYDREHGHHHDGGQRFDDRYRTIINNYYVDEFRSGRCPPGLVQKHNGCFPPGQRHWAIGQPLPRGVVVYDLPPVIISQIGLPMPGYRYVRVANDVLLLSIGTGLVVDAIRDLGGY